MVAMVWAPNVGINYPFNGGGIAYPTMASDPLNFQALDTNNDGSITWKDDPYLPFYPGDSYVDWIGISLYWYPDSGTGFNGPVPSTYFVDQMQGRGPTIQLYNPIVQNDGGLRDFYARFPKGRNKPFILAETAAPWVPSQPANIKEESVKAGWWNQVYSQSTRSLFPLMKAVVHFEESKADGGGTIRDWRILNNTDVAYGFKTDVVNKGDSSLLFAQQLNFTCGGQVQLQ